jgi:hypothetical protein
MKRTPERVAWTILFAALFACCALTVGVPSVGLAFYNTSTVDAAVDVKLQSGILNASSAYETDATVVSLEGRPLSEGSTVFLGPESVGLMTLGERNAANPLLTLQLYSNANVRVDRARLPRFRSSALGDDFAIRLNSGRIQVLAQPDDGRRFNVRIATDNAITQIDTPGTYSIEQIDGETRINVADGQAVISAVNRTDFLNLFAGQRTLVSPAAGIAGILPPARNLIRNGEFQAPLEERDWKIDTRVNAGSSVSGTATIIGDAPNTALLLARTGDNLGWGRTGVTQIINEDVRDRRSLQLRLNFQILEQQIEVCGSAGSECPFMVRIDYRDKNSGDASWTQGFYARGTPTEDGLPDYIRANNQGKHVARRLGVPETFETQNLIELLPEMQTVKSITLYAEGHAVRTQVNSVELLLQD